MVVVGSWDQEPVFLRRSFFSDCCRFVSSRSSFDALDGLFGLRVFRGARVRLSNIHMLPARAAAARSAEMQFTCKITFFHSCWVKTKIVHFYEIQGKR